ncbi:MAG: FAD-dependent oxidoreductase [Polynucleobacter sp. 32-46-5]|nr:MAG: FAD-dependent oxidoreductase [Polynucleobacter sp. 32-46-5]
MTSPQHHDIVVLGAGIAGATIANELLARGQKVCVVDSASSPASACSSHAYAIAHPHIGRGAPRLLRLTRLAFFMAEERWGHKWNQHGIFQPAKKDKPFNLQELNAHLRSLDLDDDVAQVLSAPEAKQICGIEQNGVWLPRGASLNLSIATKELLQPHPHLQCAWSTTVSRLEKLGERWIAFDTQNNLLFSANKIVVASALETKPLLATIGIRLPLRPVRGQLSIFSVDGKSPWVNKLPKTAISGDGYCLPAERQSDGSYHWMVGSSFDEGEEDLNHWDSSDEFNREQAKGLINFPEGSNQALVKSGSFVGVRCVAGDRLPIIGALTQRPGIYIATALGSRGVLWSALAAKLITAQVLQDDFALLARLGFAADLLAALAPARFFAGALAAPPSLGAFASNSKPILPSGPRAK